MDGSDCNTQNHWSILTSLKVGQEDFMCLLMWYKVKDTAPLLKYSCLKFELSSNQACMSNHQLKEIQCKSDYVYNHRMQSIKSWIQEIQQITSFIQQSTHIHKRESCCILRDSLKQTNNQNLQHLKQLKKLNLDKLLDDSKKLVLIGTFVRCYNGIVFVFLKSLSVRELS